MRKTSILLSMLVLAAMVLAACGGGATSTNVAPSPLPVTAAVTDTATEAPTEATAGSSTPGVPVTGGVDPARLSNELDFTVWSQDGEQIGQVSDMVLDLDNTSVAYVAVGTGGFLDLGERTILVPWDSLELQTGTGNTTGGQFILQTDLDTFRNAPDFDLSTLPQIGQTASDWDAAIRDYWQNAGAANPPSQSGTAAPDMTATGTSNGTGAGVATATEGAGAGTSLATSTPTPSAGTGGTGLATSTPSAGTGGTGTGVAALQGVALASDVLGATVSLGTQGQAPSLSTATPSSSTGGTLTTATPSTGGALSTETPSSSTGGTLTTATPSAGGALSTATPGSSTGGSLSTATPGTGTATGLETATPGTGTGAGGGTGVGNLSATIDDIIVDTTSGDIMFIVVNTTFDDGEHLIPVPLSMFQTDGSTQGLMLNADATMLQNAPFFQNGEFPDTTLSGWSSEFDSFWQNNGATGSGSGSGSGGASATATP